jgi:hypothetical protein
MHYQLTAAAPNDTKTLFKTEASTLNRVHELIEEMRKFRKGINVTIVDTLQGFVNTVRI